MKTQIRERVIHTFDQPLANTSGLHPKGHAVLCEPYKDPKERESLIHLPETVRERTQMLEDRVRVIEIGPACWDDEAIPRAEVGALVIIPYLAGRMVRGLKDGKQYRVINDKDVILEAEEE